MREAVMAVAGMLRSAGFTGVFTFPPSALACSEPIAVRYAGFARESRQDGEERGVATVEAIVCRETAEGARDAAFAMERAVRASGRAEWNAEGAEARVLGVDTDAPTDEGRDASGRAVWRLTVRLTMAREV